MANQASWLDIVPPERFLNDADPSQPLVVDVGGNIGHDIEKFRQVYPETAARLYLEDRPAVIELSKCPDPVNKVPHDFFKEQPIKGEHNPQFDTNRNTNSGRRFAHLLYAWCAA